MHEQYLSTTRWAVSSIHVSCHSASRDINALIRKNLKGGPFGRLSLCETSLLEWEVVEGGIRLAIFLRRTQLN